MLFNLSELEEILEVTFFTCTLRDTVPTSLLLVGPSGAAKSALIRRYTSDAFHHTDSFSSQGLWEVIQQDTKGILQFMLVPDLNPTLSRNPRTSEAVVANLLTLLYDGSVRISDGRREKTCKHSPMGLISSVTPEIYRGQAKKWLWLGLRRRIIPLFFSYSNLTIGKLQDLTQIGKIHSALSGNKTVTLPQEKTQVAVPDAEAGLIRAESERFSNFLGKLSIPLTEAGKKKWAWITTVMIPVSPQLTLRALAQARARKEGRAKVNTTDIDFLRMFVNYTDPEKPRDI